MLIANIGYTTIKVPKGEELGHALLLRNGNLMRTEKENISWWRRAGVSEEEIIAPV